MGLLDEILKQATAGSAPAREPQQQSGVGSITEMLMKNPQILVAALALLNPKDRSVGGGGGLGDVISAFNRGEGMSSWVSGGPNKPVSPGDLASALGPDVLRDFAQRAGIGHGDASSVLASVLPELVNQMTPQAQVPQGDSLDGMLGSLLGQLGRS